MTLVKTILVFTALASGYPEILSRIRVLGPSFELLVYLGLFSALAFSLWCTAFIRHAWFRWGSAGVLALAMAFVGSFQKAAADAMSYDAFVTMLHSAAFAGDAVAQHGGALAWASASALVLLIGLGLKPGHKPPISGTIATIALVSGIAVLSLILFFRGGDGGRGLPDASVGVAYTLLYGYEAVTQKTGPREPVRLGLTRTAEKGDIVLIVDESIAARYLDINDPAGVKSGLAIPPEGIFVSNFGLAASITHCSYGSNLTLRYGGTRTDYRRINSVKPSIFAYAKHAGYSTVYIDAQRIGGKLQNGMDGAERSDIDRFIQFDGTAVVNRDMAAAEALIEAISNGQPEFILINKMGAHFPVADKYPDRAQGYEPALPRGGSTNVTERMLPENYYVGTENWRRYRNSYRNTLKWTVGGFFDKLLAQKRLKDFLIIYTADHGQKLHEGGDAGTTTHCSPSPESAEGAVPLVIVSASDRWQGAAKQNFDGSSHYRIFPTLLNTMGYDSNAVRDLYGAGLDSQIPDENTFNSLFNARLGRKPIWKKVERALVPRPPMGDFKMRKNQPVSGRAS